MGADLYIEKIFDENEKKWKPVFDKACKARNVMQERDLRTKVARDEVGYLQRLVLTKDNKVKARLDRAVEELNAAEAAFREKPEFKKAQDDVEHAYDKMYSKGYFRDSYNSSNFLNRMGLSWWTDVSKLLKNGTMSVESAKKFRGMILEAEMKPPTINEFPPESGSIDEWTQWFVKQRKALLKFLDTAIKMKQPIRCSI